MRILVSVPSISFDDVKDKYLKDFVQDPLPFSPSCHTLDCFRELSQDECPLKLFAINIPHMPLTGHAIGVSGPNNTKEELFVPLSLREKMINLCGHYDKWRPYPARVLNNYSINIAKRFAKKRCKMFDAASNKASWEVLCYVDHSPASLMHLSRQEALNVSEIIIKNTVKAISDWTTVPLVLFSPYGYPDKSGFVCSNIVNTANLIDWKGIKNYFYGKPKD